MANTSFEIYEQIDKWERFKQLTLSSRERELIAVFSLWHNVTVRDETLKTLSVAIKKQFPEQAKAIVDKIAERDFAFEKFLNFMRSE